MIAGRAGALLTAAAILAGCGTTFVEADDPVRPSTSGASESTTAPLSTDTPTDELFDTIENRLRGLDQEIIDDEAAAAASLERIEDAWAIARPRIDDDTDLFNFEQALELVRTGVERKRPADASKALKIFAEVADIHLGR